jgi:hypothetical protein
VGLPLLQISIGSPVGFTDIGGSSVMTPPLIGFWRAPLKAVGE